MKAGFVIAVLAMLIALGCSTHLRTFDQNHEFLNLGNLNPLQMAGLLSGDWASILPASIQPFVRSLLGQEKQSGVSGFLSKAQGLLGGGGNNGGLFGSLGGLFGQATQSGQQSGLSGLLGNFGGALGGNTASSSLGIPNLQNLIPGMNGGSALGGLSGLSGITSALNQGGNGGFFHEWFEKIYIVLVNDKEWNLINPFY